MVEESSTVVESLMNIGILSTELPPNGGGAEFQAAKVATYLCRKHRVTIFTRAVAAGSMLMRQKGCTVRRRSVVSAWGIRFVADILSSLVVMGRDRKHLDLIIAYQSIIDGVIAALAKRLFGIPFIVSVRSEKEYQLAGNFRSRWLTPFVLRTADRVAVQLPAIKEELLKELRSAGHSGLADQVLVKLCVLPNGICSPPHERGDRDIVLYLGRLVKDKGVAYLIEAMHQCPDQHLVVAGDGPERSRLENAARVTANVEFVGRIDRDRLSAYLRRAKILVLPSLRNEGMPNAIMEAMAHGVPVVAARGGGVRDLVKDGETGYLTDPGDAAGLAHYINQLGQNHILREKMSANCVEAMKQYAWPKVIGLLEQELTGLVAESRR